MAVSGLVGVGIGQNDERAEQRSAEPGRQDDGMLARHVDHGLARPLPVRLRQKRRIAVALAAQEPLYAMPSHRAETAGCWPRPTLWPCYGKA